MHVTILSGCSGSGKTTLAREKFKGQNPWIVSADDYFMQKGVYRFDPTKLSQAHADCFNQFIRGLQSQLPIVVVDNTNTTSEEIAPYYLGAEAFGYTVEIITFIVKRDDLPMLADRNCHKVSLGSIAAQHTRLTNRRLLPWWINSNEDVNHAY